MGFVVGRVASHATSSIPVLEPAPVSATIVTSSVIADGEVKPSTRIGLRPVTKLPKSTMIGDLKLTVLKARLAKLGISAEFAGEGVLVCGAAASRENVPNPSHTVAIRKSGRGKVTMEGTVSELYYAVRREIYGLHALIAA